MPIYKDEYLLGHSDTKSLTGIAESIRLDLALEPNPHINSGMVSGKVKDTLGNPISDAVVVILDENFGTVANTITGTDGIFMFSPFACGSGYHAYSKAPGFSLAEARPFTVTRNQTVEFDFTLLPDKNEKLSIIAGEVLNTNGIPINTASMELYKVEETATILLSLSFSNEVGQFVFRDLDTGTYFVKINATGYFSDYFPVEIKKPHTIARVNATLKEDIKASKGIVMGLITDNDEQPIANADVILYRVSFDQSMIPVAYTRTNHEGIYLFVNVPQGEYRVNSNRTVILE